MKKITASIRKYPFQTGIVIGVLACFVLFGFIALLNSGGKDLSSVEEVIREDYLRMAIAEYADDHNAELAAWRYKNAGNKRKETFDLMSRDNATTASNYISFGNALKMDPKLSEDGFIGTDTGKPADNTKKGLSGFATAMLVLLVLLVLSAVGFYIWSERKTAVKKKDRKEKTNRFVLVENPLRVNGEEFFNEDDELDDSELEPKSIPHEVPATYSPLTESLKDDSEPDFMNIPVQKRKMPAMEPKPRPESKPEILSEPQSDEGTSLFNNAEINFENEDETEEFEVDPEDEPIEEPAELSDEKLDEDTDSQIDGDELEDARSELEEKPAEPELKQVPSLDVAPTVYCVHGKQDAIPVAETETDESEKTPVEEESVPAITDDEPSVEQNETTPEEDTLLVHYETSYLVGNDLFDENFYVEDANKFYGECGIGIGETLNNTDPKAVTAFEVWLFDRSNIQSPTYYLLSDFAMSNEGIVDRMKQKGVYDRIKKGTELEIKTGILRMLLTVKELEYGNELPERNSYFDKVVFDIKVWVIGTKGEETVQY